LQNNPIPLHDLSRRARAMESALREACEAVIGSGRYVMGPWLERFEKEFAAYCGGRHSVGVASGTDALELALKAADCGPGTEVVTVANAGGYATTAILHAGAKPIYADIDAATLLMTPQALEKAITPATQAVIVTHLYGLMADMQALGEVARTHGIRVIEDCAQAHGASRQGRKAGSWGDMGCFSFYPTKNLGALGDAGCVVTDNEEFFRRLQSLRQYGWRDAKYHSPVDIGNNSRMDELQAAVLTALLPHLDRWNIRRRDIVRHYREALEPLGLRFQQVGHEQAYVAHLCVIRTAERDRLQQRLQEESIATDIHYPVADYRQPAVVKILGASAPLPVTEECLPQILTTPCFPEMSDEEVARIIGVIKDFVHK
jgi:aminotransferase EvaB